VINFLNSEQWRNLLKESVPTLLRYMPENKLIASDIQIVQLIVHNNNLLPLQNLKHAPERFEK
jgi:hypothetical protein